MGLGSRNNSKGLRVIKTARDKQTINEAAKSGLKPLVKKLVPSDSIRLKYCVVQGKKTGEIFVISDYRSPFYSDEANCDIVIDWTYYYPYNFKLPFAAYLVPKDIEIGERVFLEDLIEDYIGASWNQGDTYRLESCEAIWNGKDFDIQYDQKEDCTTFMG